MKEFLYLILAAIPIIGWVYYFYAHDKGEKESLGLLVFAVFIGALTVIPAALLELFVTQTLGPIFFPNFHFAPITLSSKFTTFLIHNLVVVAIVEETFKFLALRFTVFNSKKFNEVSDGIIYGVAIALGFSAIENFLYFLNFGEGVILSRSIFTPLFHASAGAIAAHYLALDKWDCKKYNIKVYLALLCSIILHFIYNFLVFSASIYSNSLYTFLAILLLLLSAYWMIRKFKEEEKVDDDCLVER